MSSDSDALAPCFPEGSLSQSPTELVPKIMRNVAALLSAQGLTWIASLRAALMVAIVAALAYGIFAMFTSLVSWSDLKLLVSVRDGGRPTTPSVESASL